MSTKGGARVGRYELLGRIAVRGMAELFVARATGPMAFDQTVVLKRLVPEVAQNLELLHLFLDEARIAAALCHPNLVQMVDVVQEGSSFCIVLEHVVGMSLREVLVEATRRETTLSIPVAIQIVLGVAAGLHHAHEQVDPDGNPLAIVHRDVSPQNVIVTYDGNIKVLGFGVAKAMNRHNRTDAAIVKNELSYMAPEQCMGQPLDRRCDVFALGILLFELLSRHKLFHGQQYEVLQAIIERPAPRLSSVLSECPPELDRIVAKALSRDVETRYQTADALKLDLEQFAHRAQLTLTTTAVKDVMALLFPDRVSGPSMTSANDSRDPRCAPALGVAAPHDQLAERRAKRFTRK